MLFLDEPTIGLDVVSQLRVQEFLRNYNQKFQTTILLTSHYMSDIEALCSRTIIINEGAMFFDGRLADIIDRFAAFKFITIQLLPGALPDFGHLPVEIVEASANVLKLKVPRAQLVPVCRALLVGDQVGDLDIHEISAEEVVRNIFSNEMLMADSDQALRTCRRQPEEKVETALAA